MELAAESDSDEERLILQSSASTASDVEMQSECSEEGLQFGQDSEGSEGRLGVAAEGEGLEGGLTPAELCFKWAFRLLHVLDGILGTRTLRARLAHSLKWSSHFSGLGSSEVAMDFIKSAALRVLWQRLSWTVEHVCDIGRSQQQVLLGRSHGRGYHCVFGDIFDRVPDLKRFAIGPASVAVYADMKRAAESARVSPSGNCVSHGTRSRPNHCPVTQADVDVSGSPCNSWSFEGAQKLTGDGGDDEEDDESTV